jgi:hypothetical protein
MQQITRAVPNKMADRSEGGREEGELLGLVAGRTKRRRKSTLVTVGGHAVLKLNNYSLEDGEPTLTAAAAAGLAAPEPPPAAVSAYGFFCRSAAQRAAAAALPFAERMAALGQRWRSCPAAERRRSEQTSATPHPAIYCMERRHERQPVAGGGTAMTARAPPRPGASGWRRSTAPASRGGPPRTRPPVRALPGPQAPRGFP